MCAKNLNINEIVWKARRLSAADNIESDSENDVSIEKIAVEDEDLTLHRAAGILKRHIIGVWRLTLFKIDVVNIISLKLFGLGHSDMSRGCRN